jgi:2-polyprenyl-3-methyl-5-hydroxy-6-metoxy-1,4-benzoquinol methylase
VPCPICAEVASWPIAYRFDSQIEAWRSEIGDTRPYDWRLCRRCGNAYPSAQPELQVLERIWQTNRVVPCSKPDEEAAVWRYRRHISQVAAERSYRLFSPLARRAGRFLDIACGLGETVRIFADHGWDAEGIDADPSVEPLHRQLGIKSRIGQFERLELNGRYDFIHIAHAIYFMIHPMHFIGIVRDHLTPSGLFCVVISDFMSSVSPDPPSYSHTFIPTRSSLRYALATARFETVLSRRVSGSIYFATRPTAKPPEVKIYPQFVRLAYRTKKVRYWLIGKPYLGLRAIAKSGYGFFGGTP